MIPVLIPLATVASVGFGVLAERLWEKRVKSDREEARRKERERDRETLAEAKRLSKEYQNRWQAAEAERKKREEILDFLSKHRGR